MRASCAAGAGTRQRVLSGAPGCSRVLGGCSGGGRDPPRRRPGPGKAAAGASATHLSRRGCVRRIVLHRGYALPRGGGERRPAGGGARRRKDALLPAHRCRPLAPRRAALGASGTPMPRSSDASSPCRRVRALARTVVAHKRVTGRAAGRPGRCRQAARRGAARSPALLRAARTVSRIVRVAVRRACASNTPKRRGKRVAGASPAPSCRQSRSRRAQMRRLERHRLRVRGRRSRPLARPRGGVVVAAALAPRRRAGRSNAAAVSHAMPCARPAPRRTLPPRRTPAAGSATLLPARPTCRRAAEPPRVARRPVQTKAPLCSRASLVVAPRRRALAPLLTPPPHLPTPAHRAPRTPAHHQKSAPHTHATSAGSRLHRARAPAHRLQRVATTLRRAYTPTPPPPATAAPRRSTYAAPGRASAFSNCPSPPATSPPLAAPPHARPRPPRPRRRARPPPPTPHRHRHRLQDRHTPHVRPRRAPPPPPPPSHAPLAAAPSSSRPPAPPCRPTSPRARTPTSPATTCASSSPI